MPDAGGGPIPYIVVNPNTGSNTQVALTVPKLVLDTSSDEQRRKIAIVELAFARRVSALLAEAYAEIEQILRGEPSR